MSNKPNFLIGIKKLIPNSLKRKLIQIFSIVEKKMINLICDFDKKNIISKFFFKKNYFQRGLLKFYLQKSKINENIIKSLNIPGEKFTFLKESPSIEIIKELNSVAGYVPFEIDKTNLNIYNFFSKNYSIRKQLLGCIFFLKEGLLVSEKWFLLPVDCIKNIDLKNYKIDADTIIVELFHKRLPTNHGGHSGHLRFHAIYNNHSATVHSLPVEKYNYKISFHRSVRRYFPKSLKNQNMSYKIGLSNLLIGKKIYDVEENNLYGNYANKLRAPEGFNLVYSENDQENMQVRSIFHDASLTNNDHKPIFNHQLIDIPKIDGINVLLYFTETFFEYDRDIIIFFYDHNGKIIEKKDLIISNNSEINLKDCTKLNLNFIKFIVIEILDKNSLKKKTHQYINVYYTINNKICDNVHAHCLEDSRCSPNKKILLKEGNQALKWMPFPRQDTFVSIISLINTNFELNLKLRLLFPNFQEYIFLKDDIKDFTSFGKIEINLKELLEIKKLPLNQHGIIQLECRNANPNANLFTFNKNEQTLSVDHFTGG